MYTQIYHEIRTSILEGKIAPETKLPSIRSASGELSISRTTIELAYIKLCSEGFVESRPQSGYYVRIPAQHIVRPEAVMEHPRLPVKYNFTSGRIDMTAADIPVWKKQVRAALNSQQDLVSYGDPQGELCLREAIASYIYTSRGVIADSRSIVIGAGIQPLLTMLCSLLPRDTIIALDEPGFKQAEVIFRDFGFTTIKLTPDPEISIKKQLEAVHAGLYLDISANRPKRGLSVIRSHRAELAAWISEKEGRMVLEDDYNGELRYRARPIPAMQNMDPGHIMYLGSFSQLLLPSIRLAYIVLPEELEARYEKRALYYNQTASKIEQIALSDYIRQGFLEKHLRRLKKLYYNKCRLLTELLKDNISGIRSISILETSLAVIMELDTPFSDKELLRKAESASVRVDSILDGKVKLSFAGIPTADIEKGVQSLADVWN